MRTQATKAESIAKQDSKLPVCPKGKCSVCTGSKLQHHWMLSSYENEENENDPRNGEMRLICRHCDVVITDFKTSDRNCPDY